MSQSSSRNGNRSSRSRRSVQSSNVPSTDSFRKKDSRDKENRSSEDRSRNSNTKGVYASSNKEPRVENSSPKGLCDNKPPVWWIALEGIDGSGKTSQIKALKDYYPSLEVHKFPTDPMIISVAEDTSHPLEKALIFMADMVETATRVRAVKKDEGGVITDRSVISTYAYSALKTVHGDFSACNIFKSLNVPTLIPDFVIYLKVPVETALNRIKKRSEDSGVEISFLESEERLNRTYQQMEELIAFLMIKFPTRFVTIDGTKSSKEITLDILSAIEKHKREIE